MTNPGNLSSGQWRYVVTSSPESWELALGDIQAVDSHARIVSSIDAGMFIVQSCLTHQELGSQLRTSGIFVRHLFPVLKTLTLTSQEQDLDELVRCCLALAPGLNPEETVSVQTRVYSASTYRNFDVNTRVAKAFVKEGFLLDVRHPAQAISIVCADTTAFVGVSPVLYNLSDWAGGVRRYAREDGQLSRAEFKLLEALEVFAIPVPAGGTALDLGAAPGGWTRVIREKGLKVVAVDPAQLDPRISLDRGVTHARMTAQRYLDMERTPGLFDLTVNDMRIDATPSAHLLCDAARLLKPDQWAVMTLKLTAKHQRKQVRDALGVLSRAYTVVGARKLFHNRSEVTVALRRR